MMKQFQIIFNFLIKFVKASRPRFWIYLLGPYSIGIVSGLSDLSWYGIRDAIGRQGIRFFIYFSYPANLLVYGVNDMYDYSTDILNDKKKGYESMIQAHDYTSLRLTIIVLNVPFLFLSILPTIQSYLRLLLFVVSSLCYSMPPIRAKSVPFVDTIVSAIIYVSPGVIGYMISGGSEINIMLIVASIAWSMAMHAYSAIPDIEVDTKAGIRTIATVYGVGGTIMFCMILYTLACILSLPILHGGAIGVGFIYLLTMTISFFYPISRIYRYFPLINTLCGGVLRMMIIWLKMSS